MSNLNSNFLKLLNSITSFYDYYSEKKNEIKKIELNSQNNTGAYNQVFIKDEIKKIETNIEEFKKNKLDNFYTIWGSHWVDKANLNNTFNLNTRVIDAKFIGEKLYTLLKSENILDFNGAKHNIYFINTFYSNDTYEGAMLYNDKTKIELDNFLIKNSNVFIKHLFINSLPFNSKGKGLGGEDLKDYDSIDLHFKTIFDLTQIDLQNEYESLFFETNTLFLYDKKNNSNKEGCFIATKIYGSYNHDKVLILRSYRDNYLSKKIYGKFLIKVYYLISPILVNTVFQNKVISNIFRDVFLEQIIKYLNKLDISGSLLKERVTAFK